MLARPRQLAIVCVLLLCLLLAGATSRAESARSLALSAAAVQVLPATPLATEIPADFAWARVDAPCIPLALPALMKTYTPEGRLLVNEVMPEAGVGEGEWIELINVGPDPLDVSGYELLDGDGQTYVFPTSLPTLPQNSLVLLRLDGQGAGADDRDISDGLLVLHSPAGLTDILDDEGDQIAVYSGPTHQSQTLVAYMAYGLPPLTGAMDALKSRLWGLQWFVPRAIGTGWIGEDGQPDLVTAWGLFPGARLSVPRRWSIYAPTQASPGAANPVPSLPWTDPPDGAIVDADGVVDDLVTATNLAGGTSTSEPQTLTVEGCP